MLGLPESAEMTGHWVDGHMEYKGGGGGMVPEHHMVFLEDLEET